MGWDGMDGSLGLVEYRAPYGANKGSRPVRKVQFFFNIVQKAFDPMPPFVLNMMLQIF